MKNSLSITAKMINLSLSVCLMDIGKLLGKNIQRYRSIIDLTQQELADELGLNRNAVAKWETGINWPTKENIHRLADIFEVSPSKLFIDPTDVDLTNSINDDMIKKIADMVVKKQQRDKRISRIKKKPKR